MKKIVCLALAMTFMTAFLSLPNSVYGKEIDISKVYANASIVPVKKVSNATEQIISPKTVDFTAENLESLVLPYYTNNGMDGEIETLDSHWIVNQEFGTITRKNDVDGGDVTKQCASLFFKDFVYRYFDLTTYIKIDKVTTGLVGIVFGSNDMSTRFLGSGNGAYLLPDPIAEVWGSTIATAVKSEKLTSSQGYHKMQLVVTKGNVKIVIDEKKAVDAAVDDVLIREGRIGLFTTRSCSSFKSGVEVYNLDEKGTRIPHSATVCTSGVNIKEENVELELGGEKLQIHVSVLPENSSNQELYYISENPSVVTVDGMGKIVPLKTGTTVLYVVTQDGNFRDSVIVRVVERVAVLKGLRLSATKATGKIGDKIYLSVAIEPEDAENSFFKWGSSDNKVAMVNNGTVSLIGVGTCDITVRDESGKFKAICKITVTKTSQKGCGRVGVDNNNLGNFGMVICGFIIFEIILLMKQKGQYHERKQV